MLVVQRCLNSYGRFLSLSEYGHDRRHGFVIVPEGLKGVGWRRFGDVLREVVPSSFILGDKNSLREGCFPASS